VVERGVGAFFLVERVADFTVVRLVGIGGLSGVGKAG
jgi:hypothetical protein